MSPSNANEILDDTNYFLWEFNARMALARKELLHHITIKPGDAARQEAEDWRVAGMKDLVVAEKMLSPTYQSMIRDARSAFETCETLHQFFAKQSMHNRVQIRKQLHEFSMGAGENIMEHIVRFYELCARLGAVGEHMGEDEKVFVLLGSLPNEYDAMVRIIEAREVATLLEAKEMLRREYESFPKREKQEGAFKVGFAGRRNQRGAARNGGVSKTQQWQQRDDSSMGTRRRDGNGSGGFMGQCFVCGWCGHKRSQ